MHEVEFDLHKDTLKQKLVEAIGCVPTSTTELTRYIRATYVAEEAEAVSQNGYGLERNFGFAGSAVPLSLNEESALNALLNTHRGADNIIIFSMPNLQATYSELVNTGKLPRSFPLEIVFTSPITEAINVQSSLINQEVDVVLEPKYIEGYFDKGNGEWHPNSLYWEHTLKQQAKNENWDEAKYNSIRGEIYRSFYDQAVERLIEEIKRYEDQQQISQDMLSDYVQNFSDEKDEIQIP